MSQVFPVAVDGDLTGSAVALGATEDYLYFATALHCLGTAEELHVAFPPHGGDCTQRQPYPAPRTTVAEADIATTDQFSDLAVLSVSTGGLAGRVQPQQVATDPDSISVGDEVVVLGYPFAPLGSTLETWTPGHVTALGERQVAPGVSTYEVVLSIHSHPGMSGGAVISKDDGTLHGIIRGSLAPPSVIQTAGNVPLGTDTSVTFATSGHHLADLVEGIQGVQADHE